jgi:hypothetical protein
MLLLAETETHRIQTGRTRVQGVGRGGGDCKPPVRMVVLEEEEQTLGEVCGTLKRARAGRSWNTGQELHGLHES